MSNKDKIRVMEEKQRIYEDQSTHYINLAFNCMKAVNELQKQEATKESLRNLAHAL